MRPEYFLFVSLQMVPLCCLAAGQAPRNGAFIQDDFTQEMLAQNEASQKAELMQKRMGIWTRSSKGSMRILF